MNETLTCPICTMGDIVDGDDVHECVTCGHEWAKDPDTLVVTDANGTLLADGDAVTVIKDLKKRLAVDPRQGGSTRR